MDITQQQRAAIIAELGIKELSAETQEKIMNELESLIQTRVLSEVLDQLGPEKEEEIKNAAESEDQEKLQSLLSESGVDLAKVTTDVAQKTVEEFKTYRDRS